MKKAFLFLIVAAALGTGCTEKFVEPDPQAAGLAYYPVQIGDYRIYNVTDIKFRNNVGDTTRFQMREQVDTSFTDQTNTLNYKIVRSVRADADSEWQDDSVIVVTKTDKFVTEMKDNTRRVKLVFPVKSGKTWSADAFNANTDHNNDKERYTYTQVDMPVTIAGKTYPKSVTVIQGAPSKNLVLLDDRKEIYAYNIGLVYRLYNKVTYCNDSESVTCPFDEDYKLDGHEREEILISYGKR